MLLRLLGLVDGLYVSLCKPLELPLYESMSRGTEAVPGATYT